jgi:tetratricopeptide (TPR) repeat protein
MSDPLRTDGSEALDAKSDAERDAKIEQLLLTGLDHYFAAQHEQAINVWTRALFFDRNHPRARAYIERARSALAERLRESEELLQRGVAAFHRGDGSEARRLIQSALDAGAPSEEAFVVLDRLDRLEQSPAQRRDRVLDRSPRIVMQPDAGDPAARTGLALAAVTAVLLAVVAAAVYFSTGSETLPIRALTGLDRSPLSAAPIAREAGLPLPRRGEMALARARSLNASGHLHDALSALDAVRPTDPQKADADRLRVEIQQQLLSVLQTSAKGDRRLQ